MSIPLSIIIPTVDRGSLFRSPLESVIPQLCTGDELIISINGPREPVESVLEDFREQLVGIELRLIGPAKKLNIYQHWSFAISHASHKECVFVHDDEIYHAGLLAIAREEFQADPETTLVTGGHIRVIAPSMDCYRTIQFEKREEFPKGTWIKAQKNVVFPKYGCTAYIVRLQESYPFFDENTRVSDALLMYTQSMAGKVVQRPEFFGTRLLHAENTSHTDYLEPGHRPYWQGLAELSQKFDSETLEQAMEEARKAAPALYSNNALSAALPRGDQEGFQECLKQIDLAEGELHRVLKLLVSLPLLWTWGPGLFRAAKRVKNTLKPKYQSSSGQDMASEDVIKELQLNEKTWTVFCQRVSEL